VALATRAVTQELTDDPWSIEGLLTEVATLSNPARAALETTIMVDYVPLTVDDQIEEAARAGRWKTFGRRLQEYSPFLLYRDPPFGRKSAESQLSRRTLFPNGSWATVAPFVDVQVILTIIEQELRWPNNHFIPEDSVRLVMTGYELDDAYALLEIQKHYGICFSKDDFQTIHREQWTLGQFVREILRRAACKMS
jgi:hypothetical protein